MQYLVMYDDDTPNGFKLNWVDHHSLNEMKNPEFLIKRESLDLGMNATVEMEISDNVNYNNNNNSRIIIQVKNYVIRL